MSDYLDSVLLVGCGYMGQEYFLSLLWDGESLLQKISVKRPGSWRIQAVWLNLLINRN